MTVAADWRLDYGVDDVVRSQGADPEILRTRRPRVVEVAQRALLEGDAVIRPRVLSRRLAVERITHERIVLESGHVLRGSLVVEHFGAAEHVVAILATVGSAISRLAAARSETNVAEALALDAVGSAAVHALSAAACNRIESEARLQGLHTTVPVGPGLAGWPVDPGQRELLDLLEPERVGVEVMPSLEMVPLKSVTLMLGVGQDVSGAGSICDFCSLRTTCRQRVA